jgi:putative oxidoreductase
MSEQVVSDRTPQGLLILRLTLALFFAQWSIEKFIHPEAAASIFAHFYGLQISAMIAYVFGAVELAFTIGLLLGVARTIALGGLIVIHGISVLVSWYQLLHPWAAVPNHLFIASIPVLGGLVALFLLRDRDTLWVLEIGQP